MQLSLASSCQENSHIHFSKLYFVHKYVIPLAISQRPALTTLAEAKECQYVFSTDSCSFQASEGQQSA